MGLLLPLQSTICQQGLEWSLPFNVNPEQGSTWVSSTFVGKYQSRVEVTFSVKRTSLQWDLLKYHRKKFYNESLSFSFEKSCGYNRARSYKSFFAVFKGLFTRPISRHDLALSQLITENRNYMFDQKTGRLNATSDLFVNEPLQHGAIL